MASDAEDQVAAWLTQHGFPQYIALFADNAIDAGLLPTLSEADLRSIGLPFGHARKLALAAAALTPVSPAATPQPAAEPERRQLTVMFCDLVGSTALSSRLDPEELREIIRRYQKACGEVITRHSGFIAQYLGDGIMVYFGYPQAQEDAAERAVRSGLEIIATIGQLNLHATIKIQVRIGIATGLAVVGDLIGRGASEQTAVVGQTPNLAARIQALAEPGCLTIAESTRKLVGQLFLYRDLGLHQLKGIDGEVSVLQVIGENSGAPRFDSIRSQAGKCIGRNSELDFLLKHWQLAADGNGQAILAWGEAGIGKSRLIGLLHEKLGDAPRIRIRAQCSPQHSNTSLYPVIQSIQRFIQFDPNDQAEEKLLKIEQFLALSNQAEKTPILAHLLAVPLLERDAQPALSAEQQKARTLQLCADFITGLSAHKPVLYIVEDAHWIDPSTEELIALLIEKLGRHRVLLLMTGRPEYRPAWLGRAKVSTLDLGRLGEAEMRMIVRGLASGKKLPDEVETQILAKTDGIPLFVEELTRTVLESGLLKETRDAWVLDGPLPPMAIPTTLQDSLMARLDRLASAKEVIQVAAVLGRRFSQAMLATILDQQETQLRIALDRLTNAQLVFPVGTPEQPEYLFKHALVQDAAYESLLKSRRTVLHARVVRALQTHFPELAEAQPEVLAYHAARADLPEQAIQSWLTAGRRALSQSANAEAFRMLQQALALLQAQEKTTPLQKTELDLQLALAQASMALHGYSAQQTAEILDRALQLAERNQKTEGYFSVLFGQYATHTISGNLDLGAKIARRFLDYACQSGQTGYISVGNRMVGVVDFYRGHLLEARQHLQTALHYYDPEKHQELALRFGTDIGVSIHIYLGWIETVRGCIETADGHFRSALAMAEKAQHALSLAQALHSHCMLYIITRDYPQLLTASQKDLEHCEKHKLAYFLFWARNFKALAEAHLGNDEALLATLGDYFSKSEFKQSIATWWFHCWSAEIFLIRQAPQEALAEVERAEALIAQSGEQWGLSDLQRVRGDCLLAQSPEHPEQAEVLYRQAIETGLNSDARIFALRAALRLHRLLASQNREAEIQPWLDSILDGFTEGFTLPEYQQAAGLRSGRCVPETGSAPANRP